MGVLVEERKIEEIMERTVRRILAEHAHMRGSDGVPLTTDVFSRLAETGGSFDFLLQEPDLYSKRDLWKKETGIGTTPDLCQKQCIVIA